MERDGWMRREHGGEREERKRGWKRRIEKEKPSDTVKTRVKGGRERWMEVIITGGRGVSGSFGNETFHTSGGKKDKLWRD